MFQAVRHSSSGALTVFAACGLRTHVVTSHSQVSDLRLQDSDLTTAGHHMRL
jgi:hypothetical protein